MATRKTTTQNLINLTPEDVAKMTENQLRDVVQKMSSTANKRLKRLGETESGRMSPAYQSAMERPYTTDDGGKFGTSGKTLNQLRNEFKAVRNFLTTKTGSKKGWNEYKNKVYERIGGGFTDTTAEQDFWKLYRKMEEIRPQSYGSTELQTDLRKVVNGDTTELLQIINNENVSSKRKDRDKYIDEISSQGYFINENHHREKFDPNDEEDVLRLMTIRMRLAYEQQQSDNDESDFFTIEEDT